MMIRRIIWYLVVGASGVVVNLGVLTAIHLVLPHLKTLDSLVAVEASIVPNYLLNARFTFQDRITWKGFGQYNLVMAFAEIIQVTIARYLIAQHMDYRLAQVIAIPFGTAFGFLFSTIWVFRKREGAHESELQRPASEPSPQSTEGNR
jgi:dolichol-phosphate mannosyltransferase